MSLQFNYFSSITSSFLAPTTFAAEQPLRLSIIFWKKLTTMRRGLSAIAELLVQFSRRQTHTVKYTDTTRKPLKSCFAEHS